MSTCEDCGATIANDRERAVECTRKPWDECGEWIVDQPDRCEHCGDELSEEDVPGSQMGEVDRFCTACGWREVSS